MQMCQREARYANENDMCLHADGAKSRKLLSVRGTQQNKNKKSSPADQPVTDISSPSDASHKFRWQTRWRVNKRRGRLPRLPNHSFHAPGYTLTLWSELMSQKTGDVVGKVSAIIGNLKSKFKMEVLWTRRSLKWQVIDYPTSQIEDNLIGSSPKDILFYLTV